MNDYERQEKVRALCKAGQADEALNVFQQIHDKDYKLGLVRKIVEAYCEIECPEQAVLLLNRVDKGNTDLEIKLSKILKPKTTKNPRPTMTLHKAAKDGNLEQVKINLQNGGDVNAKEDVYGHTPLHIAAMEEQAEIAKFLMDNGGDVNVKDQEGYAPLHLATKKGRTEIAKFLMDNGADVNAKAVFDNTPLHEVAYWNYTETAKCLIDNGANVNAKNNNDSTPLHIACLNDNAEIAELLRGHGGHD